MEKYICNVCGWIYEPEQGVAEQKIEKNTPFKDLPDTFFCPECGATKEEFSPLKK